MIDTVHRFETPEGVDLELYLAGPVVRLLAWIVDFAVRGVMILALAIPLSIFGYFGSGLAMIIAFVLEWFYPVFFEVFAAGCTPGKKQLGLRVLHVNGTPIGFGASVLRNLLRTADFLPVLFLSALVCMLMNKRFQRLGDLAAGSIVVYRNRELTSLSELPKCQPCAPQVALSLDEQRALVSFALRLGQWSAQRAQELGALVASVLRVQAQTPNAAVVEICGMASWLLGQRPRPAQRESKP